MKKLPGYLYKNKDNFIQGPVEEAVLKELYLEGTLHLEDLIFKEGTHWRMVRDDLNLFHQTPQVSFLRKKYFLYFVACFFFSLLLYLALS